MPVRDPGEVWIKGITGDRGETETTFPYRSKITRPVFPALFARISMVTFGPTD
jgi:hypothetical protein